MRRSGVGLLSLSLLLLLGLSVSVKPVRAQVSGLAASATNDVRVTSAGSSTTTVNFDFTLQTGFDAYVTVNCSPDLIPIAVSCPIPISPHVFGSGVPIHLSIIFTFTTSTSTPAGIYPITLETSFLCNIFNTCFVSAIASLATGTSQFNLIVNAPVIPEYPLGLPLLATCMVIGYSLIKRRTRMEVES